MEKDVQTAIAPLGFDNIIVKDEEGKQIVRPDVIQAVTQLASLAQMVRIRKSLEREHVEGHIDAKTLSATDQPKYVDLIEEYPFTPYATVSFYNNGPNSARLSLNNAFDWFMLDIDEGVDMDFTKADQRIEVIHYVCNPGQTASVTVRGKY